MKEKSIEDIKNSTKKVWGASPAGSAYGKQYQPGSKDFFEAVLEKRFSYELDWLDGIVDFKRFNGKKVLEVGCGAGYDAYQFCKHGADYTGIDIVPENPVLTQKHLEFYGFKATAIEMDAEKLTLDDNTFDYVFSFGVLHHTPNIRKALQHIYNVLKVGGECQIIVYNKHSIFYWLTLVLSVWILRGKFLKMSLKDMRSKIEYTQSDALPLVNVYSKRQICKLMKEAGFSIIKTDIRKLLAEDLPSIPLIRKMYKYIPKRFLDVLGKKFGWYVSVRAVKIK